MTPLTDCQKNMGEKPNILIVDDEIGPRESLKILLKPYCNIYTAETGKKALELINLVSVDLVTLDLKMPGLSGIDVLKEIKRTHVDIEVIIITGYGTLNTATEAVRQGAIDYIAKPFNISEILSVIKKGIDKKKINQNIQNSLKKFVPCQVWEQFQKNPEIVKPKKQKATILFTDIRDFCSFSNSMDPKELGQFLNEQYFSPLNNIIFQHQGTLDKHIGDSVMAIFGAPVSFANDAYRAVSTAIKIREKINKVKLPKYLTSGIPIGIGISTGVVVCGVFGSPEKMEYTALGSPVNIAARLKGMAKEGEILITEETYREVSSFFVAEKMQAVRLKGIKEPVQIYNILSTHN